MEEKYLQNDSILFCRRTSVGLSALLGVPLPNLIVVDRCDARPRAPVTKRRYLWLVVQGVHLLPYNRIRSNEAKSRKNKNKYQRAQERAQVRAP